MVCPTDRWVKRGLFLQPPDATAAVDGALVQRWGRTRLRGNRGPPSRKDSRLGSTFSAQLCRRRGNRPRHFHSRAPRPRAVSQRRLAGHVASPAPLQPHAQSLLIFLSPPPASRTFAG